jgi:NADH:ubiquinone oxidoreductase subunit F (NADH-binding)/NADH:ubiquinone oxidoreductase subunit E
MGERQLYSDESPADHLVHRVVPPDVLADAEERALAVEEPGRMQPAGRRERRLRLPQPFGELADELGRQGQVALDGRRLDRDGFEGALAAHPARGRGVEVPAQPLGIEAFGAHLDGVGGQIVRKGHVQGSDPLRDEEAERELVVVTGSAHGDGDRPAVHANLERLLDGQLVRLGSAPRKPHHLGAGSRIRRNRVHYDRTIDVLRLTELLPELPREHTKLLDNLGRVRREVGPITPELSDALADHMNIRRGEVHEVVSFYGFLKVPTEAVRVCIGPVCDCLGAKELLAREQEHANGVPVLGVECLGHCDLAPVLLRGDTVEPEVVHRTNDGASLGLAQRDETLADYEARGGYEVFRTLPSNERVVEELKASGLAGYGGAGFPTGVKWEAVAREPGPRYVIVNADEGEPGTIKDRYVMELRPHLMLEGMLIAMRFAEASEGFIYLREEYATARARLKRALEELRETGVLDGLEVELVVGAGAYICGEETAMLESMEGRRGMPRLKPPFPSEVGYLGRPTLINNVETLAHIPAILRNGGAAWPRVRLWSLSGTVREPGCYEAPLDATLRQLIDEYAGGATAEIGALVPGGAASGILPSEALDVPLTRDDLREWGVGAGSAGVQVFPKDYSPLRLLAETMRFFAEESCQKCTPCRIGNRAMHHLLHELGQGEVAMSRAQIEEWLDAMAATSICGLGQGAPFPMRAAFRYWPEVFAPLGEPSPVA